MKGKDFVFPLIVVAGLVLLLLYDRKLLKQEILILKKQARDRDDLYSEIRLKLLDLLESDTHLDDDIKTEISSIVALINIKEETKALSTLSKIIESLLKKLYGEDPEFKEFLKDKKLKATFHTYLEFAQQKGVIKKEDYHAISILKLIRNEEQHELNVKKEKTRLVSSFIAGIAMIVELHKLAKAMIQ